MRRTILAGNWKMHKTVQESVSFIDCLKNVIDSEPLVVVFPPYTSLEAVGRALATNAFISFGAQNMYFESKGAFTGEISPLMLLDIGAKYVLIGHSERRHIFGENGALINKKVLSAIANGLTPILCIGETLEERREQLTEKVLRRQLDEALRGVDYNAEIIVAYEPVWAIGTGVNATPNQAEDAHLKIRLYLNEILGSGKGESTEILYGGSVKIDNIEELAMMQNVDGMLVGGASLECNTFVELWKILKSTKGCSKRGWFD